MVLASEPPVGHSTHPTDERCHRDWPPTTHPLEEKDISCWQCQCVLQWLPHRWLWAARCELRCLDSQTQADHHSEKPMKRCCQCVRGEWKATGRCASQTTSQHLHRSPRPNSCRHR